MFSIFRMESAARGSRYREGALSMLEVESIVWWVEVVHPVRGSRGARDRKIRSVIARAGDAAHVQASVARRGSTSQAVARARTAGPGRLAARWPSMCEPPCHPAPIEPIRLHM
jgi:hypothetical protein